MTKTALLALGGLVIALVIGVGIWSATQPAQAPTATPTTVVTQDPVRTPPVEAPPPTTQTTFTQTKAAHFVSSEPANNALLTTAPTSVKIHFNFDLAPPSKVAVTRDGTDVTSRQTTIATDKLSMSVPINAQQTGNYHVNYTACWPDKSCHNGSFGFSVQVQ